MYTINFTKQTFVDQLIRELRAAGFQKFESPDNRTLIVLDDTATTSNIDPIYAAHIPVDPFYQPVQVFNVPVIAPDFIVQSPKPKKDPLAAHAEALAEARKGDGTNKSIALIVLNLVEYIDDLEKRLKKAKV